MRRCGRCAALHAGVHKQTHLACLLLIKPQRQCSAVLPGMSGGMHSWLCTRCRRPPSLPACIWEDNEGCIATQLQRHSLHRARGRLQNNQAKERSVAV